MVAHPNCAIPVISAEGCSWGWETSRLTEVNILWCVAVNRLSSFGCLYGLQWYGMLVGGRGASVTFAASERKWASKMGLNWDIGDEAAMLESNPSG